MVRGSSKKASKSTKTSTFNSSGTPASTTDAIPLPFEPVPAALLPFTKCLPKDHVIVVHTERTPPAHRKQTFIVPVIINLIISLGLCWRLYYAVPVYLEQMITILGYETSWTVTPRNLGWGDLMTILGNRTVLLTLDYALFGLLGRWPWEFIYGDKYGRYVGCAAWKWEVGFNRPTEVVVRRGRKWDAPIFVSQEERQTQSKPAKTWTKEEELMVYNKCSTALSKVQTSKNALSLLDRDWDLDYKSMVDATLLLDQAKLGFDDIDHLALVPWHGRWYLWQPYKSQSNNGAQPPQEKDEKLEEFKKCLLQFDCEDIFYRWIEIIQYETAQPSGFTAAKKKEAEQELRKMIRNRKRDDDEFFKAIGGIENVPGLAAND